MDIIKRGSKVLDIKLEDEGAKEIACRSRGTPRIAHRLLKRVRDVAAVTKASAINKDVASDALGRLDVDFMGLDAMDKKYLVCIARNYLGGPVGIETIAVVLSEPRDAIEEIIEPYLIQIGLIQKNS